MMAPTAMLWLGLMAVMLMAFIEMERGGISTRADLLSRLMLPFIVAWWVMSDARKRGRKLCYDFDSFVFFAALFVVPVYLFQTRGVRAFLTLLCFGGILVSAGVVAAVALMALEVLQ